MLPRVQFCPDSEGRRLAFAVDGEGPVLVVPGWWVSHLERDWDEPKFRAFFSSLAEHHTVIRYDRSGIGLSDRERSDFSLERDVADLEALLDHLGYDQVALVGPSCGGPIAIATTVRRPERIRKLVLYGAFSRGRNVWKRDLKDALCGLVRAHWGVGAKAIADIFAPDLTRDESRRLARMQRDAASPEMAAELLDLTYRMDVGHLLHQIQVPTLVMHRRDEHAIPAECGRELAANIPGASLALLDGNAHAPWFGDRQSVIDVIVEFLDEGAARSRPLRANGHASRPVMEAHNLWQRTGDVWTIRFHDQEFHLKHKKGLSDLAVLLQNPSREIHALELVQGGANGVAYKPAAETVLDERARSEYQARLQTLQQELAEAEGNNDMARVEQFSAEREALVAEIAKATGLAGRPRALNDPAERARKAVAARIRDSIASVEGVCPELGAHLREAVATGLYCAYSPQDEIVWRT